MLGCLTDDDGHASAALARAAVARIPPATTAARSDECPEHKLRAAGGGGDGYAGRLEREVGSGCCATLGYMLRNCDVAILLRSTAMQEARLHDALSYWQIMPQSLSAER